MPSAAVAAEDEEFVDPEGLTCSVCLDDGNFISMRPCNHRICGQLFEGGRLHSGMRLLLTITSSLAASCAMELVKLHAYDPCPCP